MHNDLQQMTESHAADPGLSKLNLLGQIQAQPVASSPCCRLAEKLFKMSQRHVPQVAFPVGQLR
jgi:hypothetical protein